MLICMLVGAPASGKSTYAKKISGGSVPIVSSDSIRAVLYGDESIQGNPQEVFKEVYATILSYVLKNQDVIFDATNLKIKDRKRFIDYFKKYNNVSILAFVIDCFTFEELSARNSQRNRQVPEEVLQRMLKSYQEPTLDEGFQKIIKVPRYELI